MGIGDGANYAPTATTEAVVDTGEFCFAAAFLDHGHIQGQINGLRDAGATLSTIYDPERQRVQALLEAYPGTTVVDSFEEILADPDIDLVASAAIPNRRASIGIEVMQAGKDYFTDKSPFTTLEQLAQVSDVAQATGQKYAVYYAERLHNDAAWRAGELIEEGAIGSVLQVLNLAPHRLAAHLRPAWFFDKDQYGGILTDIGCHQVEQFLSYTGCSDAVINYARVENFNNSQYPGLEDFGEMSLTGDNGASFYTRVDWYTPDGLRTWGDGRTFILGTEGTLELRKYIDPGRQAPASTIVLVNREGEHELDCLNQTGFPFFGRLILDCINRTEIAMSQQHAFKAAELSMLAQTIADESHAG